MCRAAMAPDLMSQNLVPRRLEGLHKAGKHQAMLHVMTNMRDPSQFSGAMGLQNALETFGPAPGGLEMMGRERDAALHAMSSGVYGIWRSTRSGEDCGRIGAASRCFCGRTFGEHRTVPPYGCGSCDRFRYIPQRPEEVGEWWLPRRKGFNVHQWRAKCDCKHGHDRHDPVTLRCRVAGCGCAHFTSAFCCISCDRPWEEHETVFETKKERQASGRAVDAAFMPLAETPAISKLVFGANAIADSNGGGGGGGGPTRREEGKKLGASEVSGASASSENPFWRESVVAVYAKYAPEKLAEVDTILGRWAGREQMLLQRLHKKYGRVMAAPTSGR